MDKESFMIEKIRQINRGILEEEISYIGVTRYFRQTYFQRIKKVLWLKKFVKLTGEC